MHSESNVVQMRRTHTTSCSDAPPASPDPSFIAATLGNGRVIPAGRDDAGMRNYCRRDGRIASWLVLPDGQRIASVVTCKHCAGRGCRS